MTTPTATSNAGAAPSGSAQIGGASTNIITALGQVFKLQTGDTMSGERIAQMLIANMSQLGELAKQGKLNHQQITQLKEFAEKHKAGAGAALNNTITATTTAAAVGAANGSGTTGTNTTSNNAQAAGGAAKGVGQGQVQGLTTGGEVAAAPGVAAAAAAAGPTTNAAIKSGSPAPVLSATSNLDPYPIGQTLNTTNPGPVSWASAQQGRPTLTGGIPGGRISGTPAQISRGTDDVAMLNLDDNRTRRKSTPGEQSMRRSIQDLVSSVDPNVKIEPEVEDLLLSIADEFIDSVANFGCRLAKHRGGDTLEVRDLQLHLERNHNIRIPGFASDETRMSMSQPSIAPPAPPVTAKKTQQVSHMTLRSHRLAQVQQAKREAKLI